MEHSLILFLFSLAWCSTPLSECCASCSCCADQQIDSCSSISCHRSTSPWPLPRY
uniref:Uncharacterized protein n=1 Tax=Triticum urartu TaxID=4572 RepID=A0A8R7US14_TRIUA